MFLRNNSGKKDPAHIVYKKIRVVADPVGAEGVMDPPPGPVKISHEKNGHQGQSHRFHVSRPPPYPAVGSAAAKGHRGFEEGKMKSLDRQLQAQEKTNMAFEGYSTNNFAEDFMTFIVVQDKEQIKQICYKELS